MKKDKYRKLMRVAGEMYLNMCRMGQRSYKWIHF